MLTTMAHTVQQRRVIADVVRRQRVHLGLDKEPAARAADVNSITWLKVENAESVRDSSLGKILRSLDLPDVDTIINPKAGGDAPDLDKLSDDDLLAELCRRLKQRHQPQHPVPLSLTVSPYATPEDTGVRGDEEGDQRRQVGSL